MSRSIQVVRVSRTISFRTQHQRCHPSKSDIQPIPIIHLKISSLQVNATNDYKPSANKKTELVPSTTQPTGARPNRMTFKDEHHQKLNRNQKKYYCNRICHRHTLVCLFLSLLVLLLLGTGIAAVLMTLNTKTTTTTTTVTLTTVTTTTATTTTTTTTTTSVPPCSCSNCYVVNSTCCYAGICGATGSSCYYATNIGGSVAGTVRQYDYFCYYAAFYGVSGCNACASG
ncbi:unnamed protein product [Adineta steineri]|uniref:Uncharacterized protein n=1 Tax=Adineta steineri TaxID=433720 RepID=A0A815KGU7_9BILA|nr:unnamed protein product [Adineta steineri]CAF1612443.1 unnamed protein product [Adineta steineri]